MLVIKQLVLTSTLHLVITNGCAAKFHDSEEQSRIRNFCKWSLVDPWLVYFDLVSALHSFGCDLHFGVIKNKLIVLIYGGDTNLMIVKGIYLSKPKSNGRTNLDRFIICFTYFNSSFFLFDFLLFLFPSFLASFLFRFPLLLLLIMPVIHRVTVT